MLQDFTTCFVRTLEQVCYGYFEISCTPADSITSSSFWFTGNTPFLWNEIDVFELSQAPGHEFAFNTNVHVFRYPGMSISEPISDQKSVSFRSKTSAGPLKVAFDWTPDTLRWIVDGSVVRTRKNDLFHSPMFLQFDCETMPDWLGLPDLDDRRLPAKFRVDYVRTWTRTPLS
jgi:beta-glucanase (GH16 family)